jgi:hypothetical protein
MKLFKIIYPIIICLIFLANYYLSKQSAIKINPTSINTDYQKTLNHALFLAKIDPINLNYKNYLNEVEFLIKSKDSLIKIFLSTKENPYNQISTLQEILKKDKIKNSTIKIIDLNTKNFYAAQ